MPEKKKPKKFKQYMEKEDRDRIKKDIEDLVRMVNSDDENRKGDVGYFKHASTHLGWFTKKGAGHMVSPTHIGYPNAYWIGKDPVSPNLHENWGNRTESAITGFYIARFRNISCCSVA